MNQINDFISISKHINVLIFFFFLIGVNALQC